MLICEFVCVFVLLIRPGELLSKCGNVISIKRYRSVIDFRCPCKQSELTIIFEGENDSGEDEK